jgi:phage-related protein
VRDWLLELPDADRKIIGGDLMAVEFGWPCGEPLCKSLSGYAGLREVRSGLSGGRIARVFFYVSGSAMVLLHGFVKKSQKTPEKDLKLANRRKKEHERYETEKT